MTDHAKLVPEQAKDEPPANGRAIALQAEVDALREELAEMKLEYESTSKLALRTLREYKELEDACKGVRAELAVAHKLIRHKVCPHREYFCDLCKANVDDCDCPEGPETGLYRPGDKTHSVDCVKCR